MPLVSAPPQSTHDLLTLISHFQSGVTPFVLIFASQPAGQARTGAMFAAPTPFPSSLEMSAMAAPKAAQLYHAEKPIWFALFMTPSALWAERFT